MATFKITASTTVKSFSKAFKEEFGATLQIYDGRLRADEGVKLVDIGVKTGSFECRANRTVGSFIKMMQDEFNLKVKVRTADDWVTVIDGLTLNRINDLPKQPTKTMMEDYVSYQRKDTKPEEKTEESTSQVNGDKPNLVKINLVATQQEYYGAAEEEWDEWGEGGVFMISSVPTQDIENNPFEDISFLSAENDYASNQLEAFHNKYWDECEDVLPGAYVLFQDTPQNLEDPNWNNIAKALSIIFKPEYSLIDSNDGYEGPETIFEFKVYNFGDYDKWSKVLRDNAKPFYTGSYRIFKNDDGEWVGEKLED